MPLVRIITRAPHDAAALTDELLRRGYDVETVHPADRPSTAADLEISLERCLESEALERAAEAAAADDADVFVLPGALAEPAPPALEQPLEAVPPFTTEQPAAAAVDLAEPPEAIAASPQPSYAFRAAVANAAAILGDTLAETRAAVGESLAGVRNRWAVRRATADAARELGPRPPGRLERLNQALAQRRAALRERTQQQRQAAQLQRRQQQQELMQREALRLEREAAEREARLLAEQRRRQEAELVYREQKQVRAMPEAPPPPIPAAPAPVPLPTPVRPLPEERIVMPYRPARRREDIGYWRGAFVGAAVVAVILIVGWATLGLSVPSTSSTGSGELKQDVPFGPVTLAPKASPQPAAPARATVQPRAAQPAARNAAPKPSPQAAPSRRRARSAGVDDGVADDDVVVRHYPKTRKAGDSARLRSAPRRISDQP